MFEKEAEEHTKKKICKNCTYRCYTENILKSNKLGCFAYAREYKTFKNGAEFGYNKANEWHKPSEKLPEECSLVLAYSFDDTEPSLWEFVTSNQWEWLPKRIVFCSNDQIRLWKEVVLPELKESE